MHLCLPSFRKRYLEELKRELPVVDSLRILESPLRNNGEQGMQQAVMRLPRTEGRISLS